jgi:hypothetical protein
MAVPRFVTGLSSTMGVPDLRLEELVSKRLGLVSVPAEVRRPVQMRSNMAAS